MNGIRCHKQNDSPNRNDLSSFLKVVNDVEVERRAGGKLFHARGPAMANAVYTSYNTIYKLLILTVSNKRVNTNALLATVGFRVKL